MKKKILIIVGLIIVLIAGFGTKIFNDIQQENNLVTKVNEINKLLEKEDPDFAQIETKLEKQVTKGEYIKVEEAYNEFVKDVIKEISTFKENIKAEELAELLSINNIKKDGKEFTESLKMLNTSKEVANTYKDNYNKLLSDENIMSYINKKKVSDSLKDFYKDDIMGTSKKEDMDKLNNAIDEITRIIENIEKVIVFLKNNANSWEIQGENIAFSNNELVNQYNELVNAIK